MTRKRQASKPTNDAAARHSVGRLVRQASIVCPCCRNSLVSLATVNPALVGTLELLALQREPISTLALHAIRDPSNAYLNATGLCNRLAKLEAYGLAKHERHGKAKYWTATLPNTRGET